MSFGDFVQKWSGVGTFAIAVVAVLTWFFGMRDDTMDAKLQVVTVQVESMSENMAALRRDMDARSDDLEKLLGDNVATLKRDMDRRSDDLEKLLGDKVVDLRRDVDRRFDDLEKLLGVKLDTMDERYEGLSVRLENTNTRLAHVHDQLQALAISHADG